MTTTTQPSPPTADGTPSRPRVSRIGAAVSGLLAAAAGLGVGELLAALSLRWRSPIIAVGDLVIDSSPPAVTSWAIDTFGTADIAVLIGGTLVLLAVAGAGLGLLVQRRPGAALVGVLAVGVFAGYATLQAPAASLLALVPVLGVTVTAAVTLLILATGLANRPPPLRAAEPALQPLSRRSFLAMAATVAVGAAVTATAGRTLVRTFDVQAARDALQLPDPVERLDLPIPDDATVDADGIASFVTSNDDFYRIDINIEPPIVDPESHVLEVTGMVDSPLSIPLRDLLERDLIDIPITMTCVSYEIGGDLVGTAVWRGIRLRDLLDEAGVDPDADQIVGRSVDGYTCGFPLEAAYDRDAMIVVGMNGDPLPIEHGFPLRLITPGIYGYVGSTKWLAEIELTRFDAFDQYWVPRGYDALAPVKPMARIDTLSGLQRVPVGEELVIGGVAWAQTRGIDRVEVRIDEGDWQEAEISEAVNDVTWRQWRFPHTPDASGRQVITARVVDDQGEVQTEERTSVRPDGASGWHSLPILVEG